MKKFLILLIILIPACVWAWGSLVPCSRIGGNKVSGAPGSITLEDSGSLDEDATDTDAEVSGIDVNAGSYNTLAVVVPFNPEGTPESVSSVVWDAVGANESLTKIDAISGGTDDDDARAEIWYLNNPTPGVNKTVTVNFSGDLTYGCGVAVYSLSGVAQDSPPTTDYDKVGTTADETPTSLTLESAGVGSFIIMAFTIEDATEDFNWTGSGFSTTELLDADDGHQSYGSAYGTADSASELCHVAWTSQNHTALIAAAFKVAS